MHATRLISAFAFSVLGAVAHAQAGVRPLRVTRTVLPNGLVLVLNEDHAVPVVAFELRYRVGSIDEAAGQMGFAHACEHLMSDDGTPNIRQPMKGFLASIGGSVAGRGSASGFASTGAEFTQYAAMLPRNQLETGLWAMSDAMAAPLSRIDSSFFRRVVETIATERGQKVDNITYGKERELIQAAIYPAANPYNSPPLSDVRDLEHATARDVREFCMPFYVPNNAVLVLSGDFQSDSARSLVRKYFGSISKGVSVVHRAAGPVILQTENRLVLEDGRAALPELRIAWPAVGFSHPDKMALYALAGILSGEKYGFGRFGRLPRALIDDRKLAVSVRAELYDNEFAGEFVIAVTPRNGASLSAIELVVDSVVTSVVRSSITQKELDRFCSLNAVHATASIQSRSMRADTLAQSELFTQNPIAYASQISAGFALKPIDVENSARRYLGPGRVVLSLVPASRFDLISRPDLPYTNVTRIGRPQ